ncbi:MAG: class I SAM-dependent methyltransferase [Actinobacteria bacterium]|nr:class I SAM-dependent methyltransferase [Actinomycetota bacterium]
MARRTGGSKPREDHGDHGSMSRGVLFVATGDRCRREVSEAVAFLARTNPAFPVTVCTDDVGALEPIRSLGAQLVRLDRSTQTLADKVAGLQLTPYDRTLFLDTDAFLAGRADDVPSLLDRFDLAAAHAPGRSGARVHMYESDDLPSAFPQLNTGVIALRRGPVVRRTLERWAEIYAASPHHRHDQPAFRRAVYESGAAVAVVPPEWNALAGPAYYSGPVQVLHVHGLTADEAAVRVARLNATTGPRLVTPSGEILEAPVPTLTGERTSQRTYSVRARSDIPHLLNRLGLLGTGVEVGVKEGKYSEAILEGWQGRLLVSVDPWLEAEPGEYVDIANVPQERHDTFLAATQARLSRFGRRSQIWRLTGDEAATRIADSSLDFVYLDARHDYASVQNDLAVWFPKVRPGGIVAGHDYLDGDLPEGVFGVRSAVDEFFGALGLGVGSTTAEPATFPSWLVRLPAVSLSRAS